MDIQSEFSVNEDGKLCRVISTTVRINKHKMLLREPIIVQFFINGLKKDTQGVNFIYNRVYVNDRIGW
jgi:hypothetical protein